MKKTVVTLLLFFLLLSIIIPVSTQQPDGFFYDLIGRSKTFIEKYYPSSMPFKAKGDFFDGYYAIGRQRCDNDGYILFLVQYDGNKSNSVVKNVGLRMKKCNEFLENYDIYNAGDLFVYLLGLDNMTPNVSTIDGMPNRIFVTYENNVGGSIGSSVAYDTGELFMDGVFYYLNK